MLAQLQNRPLSDAGEMAKDVILYSAHGAYTMSDFVENKAETFSTVAKTGAVFAGPYAPKVYAAGKTADVIADGAAIVNIVSGLAIAAIEGDGEMAMKSLAKIGIEGLSGLLGDKVESDLMKEKDLIKKYTTRSGKESATSTADVINGKVQGAIIQGENAVSDVVNEKIEKGHNKGN